jgi:hypothetical protein
MMYVETSANKLAALQREWGSSVQPLKKPPPLTSVLYRIISGRRSVLAAQLLLREKSGA